MQHDGLIADHRGDSSPPPRPGGRHRRLADPLQAEVVQPRQLPDGLIEARRRGQAESARFVLELATYPEARIVEQVVRDMTLVFLDRKVVPEVLVLVLHPRGNSAAAAADLPSPLGWARLQATWRVIELWNVPAEGLLQAGDVGLIPWVPLAQFDGPPEPVLRRCRARIDADAAPESAKTCWP